MAEEKTVDTTPAEEIAAVSDNTAKTEKVAKSEKSGKAEGKKKTGFFKKIGKFFKDYKAELKKIAWPTWRANTKTTVVVIITLVICSVLVGVLDLAFNKGILWLGTLI